MEKPNSTTTVAAREHLRGCPVCTSEEGHRLYTVTSEEAAQHFVLREGNAERHKQLVNCIERLWNRATCSVWRCALCQFAYADPYVAGDAEFYDLAHERWAYPSEKWEYKRTIAALEARNFHGKRVLEIGAGFGLFLDKIADTRVPRSGVTTLEFDSQCVKILRGKGYEAVQGDLRSADLVPGFDAIFLFQVVEHMDDLQSLFSRLAELVASGGRIYIGVPNGKGVDFQEASGSLLDMPPNHIGRWSCDAFEVMAATSGLELSRIEIQPFSLSTFVKTDLICAYMRKTQKSGTVWNWSRAKRYTRGGKLLGAAFALISAPSRVPVWYRAATGSNLGGAIWVELTKSHRGQSQSQSPTSPWIEAIS
jgi:SAM-dependent methyltransferase